MHWVDVLLLYKEESASTDTTSLRRCGSTMSLQSNTVSVASSSSHKKTQRNLREKVGEIETFKDILFGQIETLQRYFDACAEINKASGEPLDLGDGLRAIDFKGESITFRATTAGVLTTLQHCLEIIAESDDIWRRKLEREMDRRRRAEEQNRELDLNTFDLQESFLLYHKQLEELFIIEEGKGTGLPNNQKTLFDPKLVEHLVDEFDRSCMIAQLQDIYQATGVQQKAQYKFLIEKVLVPQWLLMLFMDKYNLKRGKAFEVLREQLDIN